MAFEAFTNILNSGSGAATLGQASAGNYGLGIYPNSSQNITITNTTGLGQYLEIEQREGDITITDHVAYESIGLDRYDGGTGSPGDTTVTDYYHYRAGANASGGGGTTTVTNNYAFYAETETLATNKYAFYSANDTAKSRVGSLERYREEINALTSATGITVDCSLAPVHTVTLAHAATFTISNLGTGQTVTIIITQDGTGSRTGAFTGVKFPGGTPTLSTGTGDIDVVTIFNDGTNTLGNIAQDYA